MIILESDISTFIPSVKGRFARVSQSLNDRMYRSQSGVLFQCGFFLFFRIHSVVSFLWSPTFCPHPRLNLAERTVKPFVMARKNFLFCDTAKGADASALCFSVIETAKHNGLDPFGYLLFLLQELPKLGENPTEEQLVPLLPWAESLPEYCKLK